MQELRARFSAYDWVPVTLGRSDAGVWRLEGAETYYLKVGGPTEHPDPGLAAEVERHLWLTEHGAPVARLVDHGTRGDLTWLLTEQLPGVPAKRVDLSPSMVDSIADALRMFHALPAAACPFDRGLTVTTAHATHAVERGLVDLDLLEADNAGRSPENLLAELRATRPAVEDVVVGHGDASLANIVVDPDSGRVTGLLDVGRAGRTDPYADLALATRRLAENVARRLLRRYGIETPDADRLAYYRLLDEFF